MLGPIACWLPLSQTYLASKRKVHGVNGGVAVVLRLCPGTRFVQRRRREWHLVEGFGNQSLIVRVGSRDGESNRPSLPLGQQAPLRSLLGSIRGIGPGFFPRPAGLIFLATSS